MNKHNMIDHSAGKNATLRASAEVRRATEELALGVNAAVTCPESTYIHLHR